MSEKVYEYFDRLNRRILKARFLCQQVLTDASSLSEQLNPARRYLLLIDEVLASVLSRTSSDWDHSSSDFLSEFVARVEMLVEERGLKEFVNDLLAQAEIDESLGVEEQEPPTPTPSPAPENPPAPSVAPPSINWGGPTSLLAPIQGFDTSSLRGSVGVLPAEHVATDLESGKSFLIYKARYPIHVAHGHKLGHWYTAPLGTSTKDLPVSSAFRTPCEAIVAAFSMSDK